MSISSDKFKKVKQVSAVDQVCDHIREKIVSGELVPGERLPSESGLAELYGVNRLTVRMALQKLSVLGFIETKVGEGSFITEFDFERIMNEIPFSVANSTSPKEIIQFRKMIETEATKLAISQATNEDISELKRLSSVSETMADTLSSDYSTDALIRVTEADYAFHRQLIVCSHNALFLQVYSILSPMIKSCIFSNVNLRSEAIRCHRFKESQIKASNYIHRDLCDAISEKKWKTCKDIVCRMIDYAVYIQEIK